MGMFRDDIFSVDLYAVHGLLVKYKEGVAK